jgi:acyl transferase domain-containing protein/acyl carrier protein
MSASREPVAIVGIACRLPGAEDPAAFWRLLEEGRDAITEVPKDRFDLDAFFDPRPGIPGKTASRFGGFLDGIDRFDAGFFGVSPREAERLDPQQRLLLELAWEGLEDAGVLPRDLTGSSTGVFVGLWLNDYESRLFSDPAGADLHMTTGSGRYSGSGRLSYVFGLQGPSLTVDTACSSSLAAVHLACQSLWTGESTLALAGAANTILEPHISVAYSQSGMLSPDGRCKFGDARADGYVRSEGAGLVVLKPLVAALRDRDRIRAVITGTCLNNDGVTGGFMTTPGQEGQEQMLRAAYRSAGVSPGEVDYVEAHGTGTRAGDPVEIGALGAVLGEGRSEGSRCAVGSVKTNIGHTEAAAGLAGLIKVVLSLEHETIPASLNLERPNPAIPFADLPLFIPTRALSWPRRPGPAVAGVSAFGIAGTNAHVVLQEAPPPPDVEEARAPRAYALPLSAVGEGGLRAVVSRHREHLRSIGSHRSLRDVCYTASVRRAHHDHRLVAVGEEPTQLAEQLDAFLAGQARPGLVAGTRDPRREGKAVFVFPGQGSQWLGMGRELQARERAFRESLEETDQAIRAEAGWSLLHELALDPARSRLHAIDVVQPTLYAVEVALAALWRSWGVEPAIVMGHSMGEVAAARVAGILSVDDAVRVICRRSRLLRRARGRGAMAVVELSLDEAARALEGNEEQLSIAVSNSSRSTVLSGDPEALEDLIEQLEAREVYCRRVKVDVASHSPQMDALRDDLLEALEGLSPREGVLPLFSTVEARVMSGAELDPSYWTRNLRQPVLLARAVQALASEGHDAFIEISPHPILVPAIQQEIQTLGGRAIAVPSLKREEPEQATILEGLGALHAHGHEVPWKRLYAGGGRCVDLPSYPWQRERFWHDVSEPTPAAPRTHTGLLGASFSPSTDPETRYWDVDLSLAHLPFLGDHQVNGVVVAPAALFVELVLEATAALDGVDAVSLSDLVIESPLVIPAEGGRTAQIAVTPRPAGGWTFRISSRAAEGASPDWTVHATGDARAEAAAGGSLAVPERPPEGSTPLSSAAHYERMGARGLEYGPAFQGVQELFPGSEGAVARVALPESLDPLGYRVHPSLLDALLQVGVSVLPRETQRMTYVPDGIQDLRVHVAPPHDRALWATAALRGGPDSSAAACMVDVALVDDAGAVLLDIEGLRLTRLDHDGRRLLDSCYEMVWEGADRGAGAEAPVRSWMVVADRGGVGERLAEGLRAGGHAATTLTVEDAGDAAASIASLQSAEPGRPLHGIVHLASLDAPEPGGKTTLNDARSRGCDSVLRLVQALGAGPASPPPRLWLVTAGAQAVVDGEATAVAQSPVWGLGRAVQAEHPALRCALVDLGRSPSEDEIASLRRELESDGTDDQVALRGEQRFVPRLRRWKGREGEPTGELVPVDGRAFRVETATPGVLDGLGLRPHPAPTPGPGQIQIEVEATGLNFMNVLSALGAYPGYPDGLGPLGIECAGRVSAVGEDVTNVGAGERVLAVAFDSLASHALADARLVRPIPPGTAVSAAASVPIAFLTAHYALNHLARIRPGERVLIHAAAGGVGLAAIQLAHHAGAEVYGTAGTPEKRRLVESMGVRHVMSSRSLEFREELLERTGGEGVDVVLNSLTGRFASASLGALRAFGRFLEIGKRDIYDDARLALAPFRNNLSYFAIDLERTIRERPDLVGTLLDQILSLLEEGAIRPLPTREYPVSEVTQAFRHMAEARHTGKIVVLPRDPGAVMAREGGGFADLVAGTCLITGGLGGLGLAVARRLGVRGARGLALMGRRPPSATAATVIDGLTESGVEVRVFQGDVASEEDVRRVLAEVHESMPPLSGIVHAAGILDDGVLLQQGPERFSRVMAPKVDGAWNLHSLTGDRPGLRQVYFSSVASVLGLAGQSNYAAANAFLDALAHQKRAGGDAVTVVNWGPWGEVGLAAARDDRGGRLEDQGILSLAPSEALDVLDRVLGSGMTQVVVLPLDEKRFLAAHPRVARSLLPALADRTRPSRGPSEGRGIRGALLEAETAGQRRSLLESYLREQTAQVLRQAPGRIDPTQAFRSLGLDSLMALELRNRLEAGLGVTLPATVVWNYPTVTALGPHLAERLGLSLDEPGEARESSGLDAGGDELETILGEIENLSPEEARRQLEGKG